MKTSCIAHPQKEPMIILHRWQVEFCEGNHCAAFLLSYFEYWHNIRLEIREKARQANAIARKHGEDGTQDESLYQFHTMEQIKEGLLQMYAKTAIKQARELLIAKGAITEHRNPNPRYAFDATTHYLFHPETVQQWLDRPKNGVSIGTKTVNGWYKNGQRVAENGHAISETTTETSPMIPGCAACAGAPATPNDTDATLPASVASAPSRTPKPRPVSEKLKEACRATWKAYSDAYFARYGVEPVRNAKVNRNVLDLVKRLGATDAPHVAAWYVGHNNGYYVRQGHGLGPLLADAEKLRTEWATGHTMTATRARQIDQTQANRSALDEAREIIRRKYADG